MAESYPKTILELEQWFATDDACREYASLRNRLCKVSPSATSATLPPLGRLFLLAPNTRLFVVVSAPHLGKDAILLHFPVESPEETLETLPPIKHHFSHRIPPFLANKARNTRRYSSYTKTICQGNEATFKAGTQRAPSSGLPKTSMSPLA